MNFVYSWYMIRDTNLATFEGRFEGSNPGSLKVKITSNPKLSNFVTLLFYFLNKHYFYILLMSVRVKFIIPTKTHHFA